jgi:hypothetical protein
MVALSDNALFIWVSTVLLLAWSSTSAVSFQLRLSPQRFVVPAIPSSRGRLLWAVNRKRSNNNGDMDDEDDDNNDADWINEEQPGLTVVAQESFESEADIAQKANELATLGNLKNNGVVELKNEVENSFLQYALSIILGRALPDARDGLKPVHRRILYSMHQLSLLPNLPHRKCARVVGEVLGKYHPHGDMAVYDALVRMAQDFTTNCRLIDGHGNFGSVDNDPAAAMRYTECRLTTLATSALLKDIAEDTVDLIANFDGNEMEPTVLPSRVPLLLLNGSSGIAVGTLQHDPIVITKHWNGALQTNGAAPGLKTTDHYQRHIY